MGKRKSGLTVADAANAVELAEKAINQPGTREVAGGTVIQFAKRSAQLEGIADFIEKTIEAGHNPTLAANIIGPADAHKIKGYCEQLRIISDEVKSIGA